MSLNFYFTLHKKELRTLTVSAWTAATVGERRLQRIHTLIAHDDIRELGYVLVVVDNG